jgi:hypothetical protein
MKLAQTIRHMSSNVLRPILVGALVLGTTPALAAQAGKTKSDGAEAPASANARAAEEPQGGPQEGIKVHGHWVIEVLNPDGTLVTRREFNNFLTTSGAGSLVKLLSRTNSAGRWVIEFDGGPSTSPPSPCAGTNCVITEGTGAILFSSQVLVGTDLTVVPILTAPANLVLKGSGTVPANGTVGRVMTRFGLCADSTAPQSPCQYVGPTGGFLFTEASAPAKFTAANVSAGQIVQITVTFTFS